MGKAKKDFKSGSQTITLKLDDGKEIFIEIRATVLAVDS